MQASSWLPLYAEQNLGYTAMWLPGVILLVSGVLCVVLFVALAKLVDTWLAERQRNRGVFFLVAIIGLPLVICAWADIADISKIIDGKIRQTDIAKLNALAAAIPLYFMLQATWWMHGDKWQDRIGEIELACSRERGLKEESRKQRDFAIKLSNRFLEVVGFKGDRIRDYLKKKHADDRASFTLKEVLNPEIQIVRLIQAVFAIYKAKLERLSEAARLRVVFFEEQDGCLVPVHTWDGTTRDCLRSDNNEYCAIFDLSDPFSSLAVYAASKNIIEIVESTAEANQDDGSAFKFFNEQQHLYLRSMIAMGLPIGTSRQGPKCALTLDTDLEGFFKACDRSEAEQICRHLQQRIFLEIDVAEYLDS